MSTLDTALLEAVLRRLPGSGPVFVERAQRADGTAYLTASREGVPILAAIPTDDLAELAEAVVSTLAPDCPICASRDQEEVIDARQAVQYMSVAEFAARHGYRPEYASQMCREGRIQAVKMGHDWLIARAVGEAWVRERRNKG